MSLLTRCPIDTATPSTPVIIGIKGPRRQLEARRLERLLVLIAGLA